MESATTTLQSESGQNRPGFTRIFRSPVVWGGLLTWGFYLAIPSSPLGKDLLQRYFCAHPLEYVTATLFFVGLTILLCRGVRCWRDMRAGRGVTVPVSLEGNSLQRAAHLAEEAAATGDSRRSQRLQALCQYVARRGNGAGIAQHARFLADQASESLHEGYSLVRTITWAVPILGFLGTVIGITMAIANVTPEQLDTSLTEVTDGLAVAFDTTALALALSLVLVFASNATQRAEQLDLSRIESWSLRQVAPLLDESPEGASPLRDAEAQAARQLLAESEAAIKRQAAMWDESLEELRQRWVESLERQSRQFDKQLAQGLEQGIGQTLAEHDHRWESGRREWLEACQAVSGSMKDHAEQLGTVFASEVTSCVDAIRNATDAVGRQLGQLESQGELLLKVIEREEELVGLETRLSENLEAVRTAEAFEQTLMSLTAAANLLSARAGQKAA